MNKLFLTVLFMLGISSLFAQNRAIIKGLITDSAGSKPMEMVTVGVTDLKDSSFVSYTSTTKNGTFVLTNMPAERSLVVMASSVGYTNFIKLITLKRGETVDLGSIVMKTQTRTLNEVVVTAQQQAIVVNKDTTEFNAAAFKVRPNAVIEELLKKLPGVQVDNDGSIKIEGKAISKLKIDGKEFFGNDPRIASRNLDASLVAKVQIYDDRENDPDHLLEKTKVRKIINIKFKRAFKKSIFGKVYAGGGSRNRFESGGLFNMFRDTLQVSIISVGNNLNKTGFSYNDLSQLGGFNRSGESGIYNGTAAVGGRSYGGIERIISGGFNLNNDYGDKLKMNLIYFYSNSNNKNIYSSLERQFFTADTLFTANEINSGNVDDKHNLSGLIKWKPDTVTTITYTPKASFTANRSSGFGTANRFNLSTSLNQSFNQTSNNSSNNQFTHNFNYYRKLRKKEESLTVNHNLNINPERLNNLNFFNLLSQTSTVRSEIFNRLSNSNSKNASADLNVGYRYPISKKLTVNGGVGGRYNLNTQLRQAFDLNTQTGQYNLFVENQSIDVNRYQWTENAKAGMSYKFNNKVLLDLGVSGEWLQINNKFNKNVPDLNQRYFYLLPSGRLEIADFNLNYNASVAQPSVYDLQPITIQTTQLYAFTGNPLLKPSRNHNVDLSYNKYYAKSETYLYSYLNTAFENNSVTTLTRLSTEGVTQSMPVNRNGKYNVSFSLGLNKHIKTGKQWQLNYNLNTGLYKNRNFFILNQNEGFQHYTSYYLRAATNLSWKQIVEISPAYTAQPQVTSYTGVDFEKVKFTTHSADTRFTVRWPKRVYWEGNYNYTYNPLVSAGFQKSVHLLNASVALQMFKKDRGEIKLSCYDLLDQNISNYRYAAANAITDSQSQILKRYFLLTYMIKFNKTSTK